MNEIIAGLWIGNLHSLRQLHQRAGVWTVITLLKSEYLIRFCEKMLSEQQQCRKIVWRLADKSEATFLCDNLSDVLDAIDESQRDGRPCLVHCAMGVSRSATVCAAWLMSRQQLGMPAALNLIRQVRPEIQPNLGFVAALHALEKCNGNVQQGRQRFENHKRHRMSST